MDNSAFIAVAAPLIFCLAFIGIWVGILTFVGRFSGWNKIFQAMPPAPPTALTDGDQKTFRSVSASIGMSNYKGCLTANTSRHGLTLTLWKIFSFGHQQPLFIPWNEINTLEPQKLLGFEVGTTVKLRNPNLPNLTFQKAIFQNNPYVPMELQQNPSL